MEIRILKYFLAVVREGSILGAANALHMTQPSLSRQMRDLEEEIGKPLFIRSNRRITLTEEGILLRNRATEILDLVQKTEAELQEDYRNVVGDVRIVAGNNDSFRHIADIQKQLQTGYPGICFHYSTGDGDMVRNQLDMGLSDFGVVIEPFDVSDYDYIHIPDTETFGVLMRDDAELTSCEAIDPKQLIGKPLMIPKQFKDLGFLSKILGGISTDDLDIRAIIDNPYNGAILTDIGIGYALCIDFKMLTTENRDNHLVFRPLKPEMKSGIYIIWKKYQYFSHASELFLNALKKAYQK